MGKKIDLITVKVNERNRQVPRDTRLLDLKGRILPASDLIIYNGFPISENIPLKDGDEVVLIEKGKIPDERELECLMVARHSPGVHGKVKRSTVGIDGLGETALAAMGRHGMMPILRDQLAQAAVHPLAGRPCRFHSLESTRSDHRRRLRRARLDDTLPRSESLKVFTNE